jgi:hypothetical protein
VSPRQIDWLWTNAVAVNFCDIVETMSEYLFVFLSRISSSCMYCKYRLWRDLDYSKIKIVSCPVLRGTTYIRSLRVTRNSIATARFLTGKAAWFKPVINRYAHCCMVVSKSRLADKKEVQDGLQPFWKCMLELRAGRSCLVIVSQ